MPLAFTPHFSNSFRLCKSEGCCSYFSSGKTKWPILTKIKLILKNIHVDIVPIL